MFVCKVCKEKYSTLEGLYAHLEEEHASLIPPNMTTAHYYYYLKTGRKHGNCVMCKRPTKFNEKTKKYHRFCEDPACKQKYKEVVDKRMIGVYGKVNLLNDPEQQRKMLMNRSISGKYNFDGVEKPYVGSYELDFLKTMDLFFDWDPNDIVSPSPHTYYYEYDGQKHFYIPDFYIMSLGLEIEVKDGGDNPNRHHKIQDVDKEKEKLKDKVMHTQKINHYVKLTNKNYYNLFEFFRISKEYVEKYGDYEKIPKIILDEDIKTKKVSSKVQLKKEVDKAVNENYEVQLDVNLLGLNEDEEYDCVEEGLNLNKNDSYINFNKFESGKSNVCLITGYSGSGKTTLGKQIASEYDAYYIELDMFHNCGEITDDINANAGNIFNVYFNKDKKSAEVFEKIKNRELSQNNLSKEFKKFFKFTLDYCKKNKNDRFIIEGVQIFELNDGNKLKKYPIIIKNTSMLKSMGRMMRRDKNEIISDDKGNKNYFNYVKYTPKFLKWYLQNKKDFDKFKDDVQQNVDESYVCFPLLNSIISSNYNDVKSKAQYKKDVEGFKHHFLQGISDIKSIDDAKAMKSDLEALTSYLHDIKYTNKYSDFKNITAVKDIEKWMTNTAMPQIDEIIKKYEKKLEPVTEYNHTVTFALNNNMRRGLYGLMDNVSSIIIDDTIQIKRINNIMSVSESLDINDNTTNISFGTNDDIKIKRDVVPYLIWNKNQSIESLLESFVKEWLVNTNSNDFTLIQGGDD